MAISPGGGTTEETRLLWRLAGMGFQFGTEIIAGVLIGWFVDRTFGTNPWGVMIGSLAGIAVATLDMVRKAMRLNREMDREAHRKRTLKPQTTRSSPPPLQHDAEELTHEQWKAVRDRELDPEQPDDDLPSHEHER